MPLAAMPVRWAQKSGRTDLPPSPACQRADRPAADPVRVFVVEDDALSAIVLNDLLDVWGYAVCGIADTATAAVREIERHRPDIVLMDVRLADNSDGISAAQEIRRRFDIRCVFITAHTDRTTVARVRETEPLGFLSKPYMPEQLRATLREALDRLRCG